MLTRASFDRGLQIPLRETHFAIGPRYEGKVRDNYALPGGRRLLVTTDRISAFDRVLCAIPFKGQILNRLSAWWFGQTAHLAPNHLRATIDPNAIVATECRPLPLEVVVRAYLTGVTSTSIWSHYQQGRRAFGGLTLPDGMKKNEPLPAPIVTPSTKAEKGGHDITVSREDLLGAGLLTETQFEEIQDKALRLFAFGQHHCQSRGLLLVDTKYEFGISPDGQILLIDEMHTPDSSRFWDQTTYETRLRNGADPDSFDKEFIRNWLKQQGFSGDGAIPEIPPDILFETAERYASAFERICGTPFTPDLADPEPRIQSAITAYLGAHPR